MDPALVRGVALFGPVLVLAALLRHRPPERREIAALILAISWNTGTLAGVNALAIRAGWWTFEAEGGTVGGIPVDLLLGWAALWGALAVLALRRLPMPLVVGPAIWI